METNGTHVIYSTFFTCQLSQFLCRHMTKTARIIPSNILRVRLRSFEIPYEETNTFRKIYYSRISKLIESNQTQNYFNFFFFDAY